MRKLFKNARLIFEPDRSPQEGFLIEEDGVIRHLEISGEHPRFERLREKESLYCDEVIDCEGDYLSPGFIDLHCHGALGIDTMEATSAAFDAILNYHATRGTTLAVLTTVAATLQEMVRVLSAAEIHQKGAGGSCLAGIHLEGPYFSPMRCGAHRPDLLRYPNPGETRELLRHRSVISRMSLAPELPGALELIRELVRHGISASAGHSDATEEEATMGFEAGVTQVTHLYNCMSSLRNEDGRRVIGLAEAALTTPGILCEVIADGKHLPAALLRLTWLAKGWNGGVIVSDATGGAGLPEGTIFELGGLSCRIEQGAAWTGGGETRRLAGSNSGMIDGVKVMVEQAQVPLQEAVAMATLVPARALRLQEERGSLATGKRADLLRFSEQWQVRGVWAAGKRIH
jgi:N-acetylglucosamine-6-phosphate deacetylase